jgi:hypothetical protein
LTSPGSARVASIGARQRRVADWVVTGERVNARAADWIAYPVSVSWAFWGDVTIVLAIVGFVWGVARWVIRRVRRRAMPPVESAKARAVEAPLEQPVQPPPQVPPAQIVYISSSQAPSQAGAASTFPGPATALGTPGTNFETFGLTDATPKPAFGPGITGPTPDDGSAEDRS